MPIPTYLGEFVTIIRMTLHHALLRLVTVLWLTALTFGQFTVSSTKGPREKAISEFRPGIVVETVKGNSAADRAGIREGDVFLSWSRGNANGKIQSPFDLSLLEIEEEPRGQVTIEGLRGTEQRNWKLDPGDWGVQARPNFHSGVPDLYREGQQFSVAGNSAEAAKRWRILANQLGRSGQVWLFAHAGREFADGRAWKEADDAYQEALAKAKGSSPKVTALLLWAWGRTFLQRNDWANAERVYRQSIAACQKLDRQSLMIANNINDLGEVARKRGKLVKAQQYEIQALSIRQRLAPESLVLATSLTGLGNVATDRGDLTKAQKYYDQALGIRQKLAPESLDVSRSLNDLGNIACLRGDLAKAEEYGRQSLKIKEKLAPHSLDVAITLNNLGIAAEERGDLAKAVDYDNQALTIEQRLSPGSLEVAASLSDLGIVAWAQGDMVKAEDCFRQALVIREKLAPGSLILAASLISHGALADIRGDLPTAREYYAKALAIQMKLSPDTLKAAQLFNNLGFLAAEQGDLAKADEYYQQALVIRQKMAPESTDVVNSFVNIGALSFTRGDLAKAEEYYHRALVIQQRLAPGSLGISSTLNCLGDLARERRDLGKAEEYYRQALEIRERTAPGSRLHAETLASLAEVKRRTGQLDAAAQLFEQSLNALESQYGRLGGSQDIRAGFRARFNNYYRNYVDVLVHEKQPERAFEVLERSRARSLLEILAEAQMGIHQGVEPRLLEEERRLHTEMDATNDRRIQLLMDKHTEAQVAAVSKELEDLASKYQEVEGQIRISSPGYAILTQPQSQSLMEIQQLLDSDTIMLEYSLGEERSYLFAITPTSLEVFELAKRGDLERASGMVRKLLTERGHYIRGESLATRRVRLKDADARLGVELARLSQTVLGPVAGTIGRKRLLVVSDGALQYIPFAILPSPTKPDSPLVTEHEIVNLPSASVLAVLRTQEAGRQIPAKTVVVVADPVFNKRDSRVTLAARGESRPASGSGDDKPSQDARLTRSARDVGMLAFPRLPYSRREAAAIMSVTPPGQGLEAVDFDANRSTVASRALAQYRIVHFATHGLFDNEHPELSGLVFSLVDKTGKSQNGFVTLEDIFNFELPVDLVVLSACGTGLGKEIQGEGLVGLTRGFMYAGASRVVASLWSVDDAATSELMQHFYQGMLVDGQSPAAALRQAQIDMWKQKRWKHPYYWGAFLLQGEWKPLRR